MADKELQASDFVHLHNHSHHSLLDGLQKIPNMVAQAKKLGMNSLAITDHGTMSGAIEMYKAANAEGIKPIIGIETYVAARKHTDKDPQKDKARHHLILLAMNNQGYKNMMRLSTIANLEGFYHKARVDHDLLEEYNEGIIALSGCIGGEVGENLRYDQDEKAEEIALWYKSIFGDRYYLEVQDHGHMWDEQAKVNKKLIALGKKHDIPLVLTCDAHYLRHEDQEAHEVLLCIQTGSFLNDSSRMSLTDTDLYLTDPKDVIERWGKEIPEAISNTGAIADRCEISINLDQILIPKFDVPDGESEHSYLQTLIYQGLMTRYKEMPPEEASKLTVEQAKQELSSEVIERTEYEAGIIHSMGFDGYFLIVQDFMNWGKSQGIVFGPGRGSAAGSIVAYSLNITDLDPLKYDLLFERFLNPDRISMPDIDIDIQDSRRDEVIQYCVEKYGQESVAHIVTFGKMAARNAIRDVARVLEVPYADADRLAKMVPAPVQGRHIPLEVSLVENADLKEEYESNPQSKRVMDLATRLEGTMRSHGVHAAGVVIAPGEIVEYAPLEMAQKGVVATQYPMNPVEELGLLKMDFLGLSNLTIVNNAMRIIKRVHGVDIDIAKIDLEDKKTFELLGRGDTTGVFQLESGGMKRYIKQLQPNRFEDIIAMVALYRPGPMQFIDDFIARKNGKKEVTYQHPKMKDALEESYGILVYQEQVMQIAKEMCGFTGGQADTLRKAIGKKIVELMAKLKEDFIKGGMEQSGADRDMMEVFWKQLEDFAAYCFNKSHAACYALISFWTAYLKAHYPAAFMAALMTSDFDDTDRLAIEISECRRMGLEVLPPHVNESFVEFSVVPEKSQIRFGMAAVKNVGTAAVEEIIRARELGGEFKSIEDFVSRVSTRTVNRKAWESLVKAGAFDDFKDRNYILFNLDAVLAFGAKVQKEALSGQTNLFAESEDTASAVEATIQLLEPPSAISERETLQWERELLGLYLSKHPLDGFENYLAKKATDIVEIKPTHQNKTVKVGGVVSAVREITTKKGAKMAFVGLEDKTGFLELIVFPEAYKESEGLWVQDNVIIVKGKVNTKDREGNATEEIKVLVDTATEISDEDAAKVKSVALKAKPTGSSPSPDTGASLKEQLDRVEDAKRLFVHVKKPDDNDLLLQLKKVLNQHPGATETVLVLGERDKSAIRLPCKVDTSNGLQDALSELVEQECVVVK